MGGPVPVVQDGAHGVPAAPLRPFVAHYRGYRESGVAPATHAGLPSPFLTLILTLDDPLDLAVRVDRSAPPARFEALVGGLHTAPVLVRHDGRQSGVQVALTPWGARALLGPDAGALAGLDEPADAVLGPLADALLAAVRDHATWPRRFAALDAVLLARLAAHRAPPLPAPEVLRAWDVLTRTGGRVSVTDLAAHVGWSPRHLAHRFSLDVGLSPKQAARVVRFDRARRHLQAAAAAGRRPLLADLAAAHGYADQPHLDREFRALAGDPPSVWLARELRNVQVGDPADGAG